MCKQFPYMPSLRPREGRAMLMSGRPGWVACTWVWPERSPRAQPPRAALPRGGVAVRLDAELWAP